MILFSSFFDAVCTIAMTALLGFVATVIAILIVEQIEKRKGRK